VQIRRATSRTGAGGETDHESRFTAFKFATPFRPARITPKPSVGGPHTATVVGPPGEEIHVDKYGRVKVQFHWDRVGQKNDASSCWVRVAQVMAGKTWGMMMLPRIGHEVVVGFLEGDPDQPVIVGAVYNAENMPPWALPANKTQSGLITRSSLGGGAADFNALRFEDKKGSEQVWFHAQKDRDDEVEHDLSTWVGHDEIRTVDNDSALHVKHTLDVTVDKNYALTIGEEVNLDVGKNLTLASGENFGATVGKQFTVDAGSSYSMKAATEVFLKAGSDFGAEAGANVHIKGGANVVIEAGAQLTLKSGGNSVVIGPDGVSITGTLVKINSGGGAGGGGGAKPVKPTKAEKAAKREVTKDPAAGGRA
jgi:type VI secretion system secreted protein VgrG